MSINHLRVHQMTDQLKPGDHRVQGDNPDNPICVFKGCPRHAAGNDEACLYHLGLDTSRAKPRFEGGWWD